MTREFVGTLMPICGRHRRDSLSAHRYHRCRAWRPRASPLAFLALLVHPKRVLDELPDGGTLRRDRSQLGAPFLDALPQLRLHPHGAFRSSMMATTAPTAMALSFTFLTALLGRSIRGEDVVVGEA